MFFLKHRDQQVVVAYRHNNGYIPVNKRKNCVLLSTNHCYNDNSRIVYQYQDAGKIFTNINPIMTGICGFYDNSGMFIKDYGFGNKDLLKEVTESFLDDIKDKTSLKTLLKFVIDSLWFALTENAKDANNYMFNSDSDWIKTYLTPPNALDLLMQYRRKWRFKNNLTANDCRTYRTQTARNMVSL